MKFSIIIPTFNLFPLLQRCLDSVIANSDLSDKEIIVVSNGCFDGTMEYLQSKPVKIVRFEEAIGYPKAVNAGLKVASGEFIILLNNDIQITNSNWIYWLLKPFFDHPDCGITGPGKWMETIAGKEWSICAFWCAMFKKELLDQIGLLDEIFSPGCGEDLDFCIRAALVGKRSIGTPDDFQTGDWTNFPINHVGGATFAQKHEETQANRRRSFEILNERYKYLS